MNRLTQAVLEIARGFVGVREVGGNNCGPQVEEWLRRVGQPPGKAWCMAFQWCIVDDGFAKFRTPNPIRPCASVVRMWDLLPDRCKLAEPVVGCWAFHRDPDNPQFGHIGIVDALDSHGETFSIEGNTNAEGSRTGGGVWRHTPKLRPRSYWNLGFGDYTAAAPVCWDVEADPRGIQ